MPLKPRMHTKRLQGEEADTCSDYSERPFTLISLKISLFTSRCGDLMTHLDAQVLKVVGYVLGQPFAS